MRKTLVKAFFIGLIIFVSQFEASGQCKSGWLYGRIVTIDNTASNNDKDSTSKLVVINTSSLISASKMRSDGGDIRFVDALCNDLNYWVESGINTASTRIWVRVPKVDKVDSVQIEILYGNGSATSNSKFNLVFPRRYIATSTNYSGLLDFDYVEIPTGVTLTLNADSALRIEASYIVIDGTINGEGKGYTAPTSCVDGSGPGGASRGACNNGGGGAYGGQGGCPPRSGAPSCGGSRSSTYGSASGFDIDKGSSGSLGGGGSTDRAGDGGGAVILNGDVVAINGTINVNGEDGLARSTGSFGGGGGAGGGILITSRRIEHNTSVLTADGGLAGNSYGASGGGGRIKLFYKETTTGTTNLSVDGFNDHAQSGTPTTLRQSAAVGAAGTTVNSNTTLTETPAVIIRNEELRNSIATNAITGTNFCSGDNVTVSYTTSGVYTTGNKFEVQLSDKSGSFVSPTVIGSVTSTTATNITATIPGTVDAGSAYRLRVVSTSPTVEGSDNGSNFFLNAGIAPKFSFSRVCEGFATVFIDVSTIQSGSITSIDYDFDNDGVYDKTGLTAGSSTTNVYPSYGTYTCKIRVKGSNGCSVEGSETITVDALPEAKFSASTECIGDSTTFTDASTIAVGSITTVDFDFNNDGVYDAIGLSQGATIKHKFATAGTKNVSVRVNTNRGCSEVLTRQVFVDPYPVPNFTINAAQCVGDTLTFTDVSTATNGTIATIDYDFDSDGIYDLTNQTPGSSIDRVYTSVASSFVVIRATTTRGCVNTNTKSIDINDKAVADYITQKECKGTPVKFTDQSTLGVGSISNIEFDLDNDGIFEKSNVANDGSVERTYYTIGAKTINMRVTTDKGCVTEITKGLNINPDPVPNFVSTEECAGTATIFKDTSLISAGSIASVDFDFDNDGTYDVTGLGSGAFTSNTYSAAGPKDVKIRATSDKGCSVDSVKAFSITKAVSVNPNPIGAFASDIVCFGDSTRFIDNSTVSSGTIISTQFDFDNDGVYDKTIAKSGDTTYATLINEGINKVNILTLSDKNCLSIATQNVSVYATPVPTFTVSGQCEGQKTEFVNSTTLSIGTITTVDYDFDNNGIFDTSGVAAVDTVSYQYNSFGIKTIVMRAISNQGCVATASRKLNYSPLPDVGFSFSNNCLGENSLFSNSSMISVGTIKNYYWSLGDGGDSRIKNAVNIYDAEGTYNVELVVESDNGCFDTLRKDITVYPQPTANFSTSNVCEGETAIFKNNSSISTGALLSVWDFDNGQTSSNSNPSALFNSSGRYAISLTVTSVNGCKDSISKSLDVYSKPQASFTTNDVCEGATAQFDNKTTGAVNYNWNFGDASTASALLEPSHTYATTGSYNVTLIATGSRGCIDTVIVPIDVFANPSADFNVSEACFGVASSFSNNSSGAKSYLWTFGDGASSSNENPSRLYTSAATYTTTLIASSDKGCTDTIVKSAVVNPLPNFQLTATNRCATDSIPFSVTGSNLNTVLWNFGDGVGTAGINAPKYKYVTEGSYTVSFYATSAKSCTDSGTVKVEALAVPNTAFSTSDVCLNQNTVLSNSSSISKGSLTYAWDFGDSKGTSTQTSPTYSYTSSGTYTIQLISKSDNGCLDTAQVSVDVFALPTASFATSNICLDDQLPITNNSTGASSYAWMFGDGNSTTGSAPKHFYATAGNYTVSLAVENSNGCKASTSQSLNVFAKPNAAFTNQNNCFNEFSAFNNFTTNVTSYAWDFGDATGTSTAENPSYLYGTSGTYSVRLIATSSKGCKDTATQSIVIYVKPTAAFAASNVCIGNGMSFTNNSTSATKYNWQFGNGLSSTTQSPTYNYPSAGDYDVQLIASTKNNCADTAIATVSVYSLPEVDFEISNACFGDSVMFSNTSAGTNSYAWNFGDANTSSRKNTANLYAASGNYNVVLTATNSNNCVDSVAKVAITYALPKPDFSSDSVCLGERTSFSNLTLGNIASTLWKLGNGNTSFLTNPFQTYGTAGSFDATLITTNNNGCIDSITKAVVVHALPEPNFTVSDVCLDKNAKFASTSSISNGSISSYAWQLGDGNRSTDENPIYKYAQPAEYFITLTTTSDKACVANVTKSIKVYSLPKPSFAVNPICFRNFSNFKESIESVDAIDSIYWDFGDASNFLGTTPRHIYNTNGNFNVSLRVTTIQGCVASVTNEAVVYQKPEASFTVAPICFVEKSAFVNTSNNATRYIWGFGDGGFSLSENPEYQYINPGTYSVSLVAQNSFNCFDTAIVNAVVYENPVADFDFENVCLDASFEPSDASIGNVISQVWYFGTEGTSASSAPSFNFANAGDFDVKLTVTSNDGCKDSILKLVSIYALPAITMIGDTTISKGNSIELWAMGGYDYIWTPSEDLNKNNKARVIATPLVETNYQVSVQNENGCLNDSSVTISVNEDFYFEIANLITPDGNGLNDVWMVKNIETYNNCTVQVFDEFGRRVYESSNYMNNWDGMLNGKELPEATYYYVIDCNNGERLYKGAVTILRTK